MKKYLLLITTAIFTFNGFSQVPDYVPSDGLVGWWPFNGNADDESGNNNNGTVNGAILTADRDGNTDAAYNYNGINQFIQVPHSTDFNFDSGQTISLWFNRTAYVNSTAAQNHLISKGATTSNGMNVWANKSNNNTKYHYIEGNYSTANQCQTDPGSFDFNEWVNLTIVNDLTDIKMYFNGTLAKVCPVTNSSTTLSGTEMGPMNFGLGRGHFSGEGGFNGKIDDIGIWDRALTPTEITTLYKGTADSCLPDYVPTDGLVGYWPFCGNAVDESGNNNNGAVNGATLTTDRKGNNDSAYDFDGTDDNISVNHSADFDFTNTDAFSIQAWVKSDLLGSPGMIVSKIQHSGTYRGYEVFTNTLGEIGVYLINDFGAGNYILLATDETPLSDKKVHNVVVTYDGSSNASGVEIYVDGVLYPHTATTDNLSSTMQNTIPVNIGSRNEECCYESADIDDVGIWNRVLTNCEIQELYNSQLTATPDNTVTQSGNTLTATQTGATYQWLDCDNGNAAISGATNQSYSPGVSGNFAVEVTVTDGSCEATETSACQLFSFVGVEEKIHNNFSVYPNPTKNSLTIQLNQLSNTGYIITDGLGKVVKEGSISSQKQDIDVSDLSKGVYVITVGEVNQKFIKE